MWWEDTFRRKQGPRAQQSRRRPWYRWTVWDSSSDDQRLAHKIAITQKPIKTYVLDLTVRLVELSEVELGGLEELGLSDVNVLEGEDSLGGLLDLSSDRLGNELLNQLLQLALALPLHDLVHLGPDLPDLSGLSVRGLLDLLPVLSGESDGEKPDEVSVRGSDIDVSLDQRLPLSDQRSNLVGGEVHSVERSKTVLALLRARYGMSNGLIALGRHPCH